MPINRGGQARVTKPLDHDKQLRDSKDQRCDNFLLPVIHGRP